MKLILCKLIFVGVLSVLFCAFVICKQSASLLNPEGKTISERFNSPKDYTKINPEKNSFAYFLQQTQLKPNEALVHYFNGEEKPNKVAAAVLNTDVGNKDLQQCADAVMRLRAEYLYSTKQFELLHFNFTNGFCANYTKWRKGYRIVVSGNKISWVQTTKESLSYQSFKEYLQIVFTYAGTASLAKELKYVTINNMEIGDVFIKGGSPGHAVIVVNMAIDKKSGNKLFMIAQSYMPAQDIHVLVNKKEIDISPWYKIDLGLNEIETPEWVFEKNQLMRFQ